MRSDLDQGQLLGALLCYCFNSACCLHTSRQTPGFEDHLESRAGLFQLVQTPDTGPRSIRLSGRRGSHCYGKHTSSLGHHDTWVWLDQPGAHLGNTHQKGMMRPSGEGKNHVGFRPLCHAASVLLSFFDLQFAAKTQASHPLGTVFLYAPQFPSKALLEGKRSGAPF